MTEDGADGCVPLTEAQACCRSSVSGRRGRFAVRKGRRHLSRLGAKSGHQPAEASRPTLRPRLSAQEPRNWLMIPRSPLIQSFDLGIRTA